MAAIEAVKPIQIVEFPGVGNLLYDELGKLVLRKLNERFKHNYLWSKIS